MSVGRPSLGTVVRAFAATLWDQIRRDHMVLFVAIVLPVLIIVIIGTTSFGRRTLHVGVSGADTDVMARVLDELDGNAAIDVERLEDLDEIRQGIRRYALDAGLVLPADADAQLAAGEDVEIVLIVDETSNDAYSDRAILEGVIDRAAGPLAAAGFAAAATGASFEEATAVVDEAASGAPAVSIETETIGSAEFDADSPFSLTAAQNLVLFSFITALTSAGLIVVARRSGVLRRTLSTPAGVWPVVIGLGAGWFVLAAGQGALIMAIGAVVFGVDWGDPLAAAALLTLFAAVGCGAGLLVGALFSQEDQVSSITPPLGIVLGALGGCMVPSEIFPPVMLAVSRLTPHYWALEGWKTLVFDGGGLADVGSELAVLVVYGAVLVVAAATLLRRRLIG